VPFFEYKVVDILLHIRILWGSLSCIDKRLIVHALDNRAECDGVCGDMVFDGDEFDLADDEITARDGGLGWVLLKSGRDESGNE